MFDWLRPFGRKSKGWTCRTCGETHGDIPLCFGIEAPWRALVSEDEFAARVRLTEDQCVIDEEHFFIRGHIEIPIHGHPEPLVFAVWSSLSENSFVEMGQRWNEADRVNDAPYFGWLSSPISVYPSTIHLKLNVRSREPGLVPLFELQQTDHPLSVDQRSGVSIQRWHELVHALMA